MKAIITHKSFALVWSKFQCPLLCKNIKRYEQNDCPLSTKYTRKATKSLGKEELKNKMLK